GVFSSRMPSHSWPVVAVPVTASTSVLSAMISPRAVACGRLRRTAPGVTAAARMRAPAGRPRRNTPGPRSERTRRAPDRSRSSWSPDVGLVVVELEVDQRAEHLQIGDQRVGLGDAAGVAVVIARQR